ncbi:MbcA/ParS/Xre antitoxin family protein [Myxosarcina sp. GI1]|uniref:MbcA/ParS/Xre antitoxin family protein n=1 Tax=Myxosarcina sp. GI1 TaxID=1541065 RepID=UPI0005663A7B|nr:MbcA/ParS/Xre antitoxin family protein [Myxosarcina sp. GI1]
MAQTIPKLQPVLPIYNSGELSLKQLASFIGVNQSQMAKIAAVNPRTVDRDIASEKTTKKLQPLIHLLKMLMLLTDGSADNIRSWLKEPLVEWYGESPLDSLLENDLQAVEQLVGRIYEGDSAGY